MITRESPQMPTLIKDILHRFYVRTIFGNNMIFYDFSAKSIKNNAFSDSHNQTSFLNQNAQDDWNDRGVVGVSTIAPIDFEKSPIAPINFRS